MNISINDPYVRESIYHAYRGMCFYTGRQIPKEEMVIDHLIPKAKGGEDSIYNCVLTYQDANLAKRDKIEQNMIERMQFIIKVAFAPRVEKKLKELRMNISKKKKSVPKNLICVWCEDLFWAEDKGIKILTSSASVTASNIYYVLHPLKKYIEIARSNESTFCDDAWLTSEFKAQIESLYYEVGGQYYKIIKKTKYYERNFPDRWATIFFNEDYFMFLDKKDAEFEEYEEYCESEIHDEYNEFLKEFCRKYPPPEKYRNEIIPP